MKKALFVTLVLSLIMPSTALAAGKCVGQTVYVPATYNYYPNDMWTGTRLIIRNLDPVNSFKLTAVDFRRPEEASPEEDPFHEFVTEDVELGPWASITFLASSSTLGANHSDGNGGRPFFIVKWESEAELSFDPLIEGLYLTVSPISAGSTQYVVKGLSSIIGTVISNKCD